MTKLTTVDTSAGIVYETRLANGLLVILKPDHKAPVINLNVAYRVGSKYERPGVTGISHLLEHMMFKTSNAYPLGEFDRRLKTVGADSNAFTWLDQTVYYETIAADKIDIALMLEADRMRNLALLPEDHAFEMTVVRNELDQRDDSPFTLLYEDLLAVAFVAHPYRVPTIGYTDDVEGITTADLREHYDRFYHPANAFIVAVGDFEPEELLGRIEQHFGALPAGEVDLPRLPAEPTQYGERRFEINRSGQVDYLLMGWHIPGPRHADSYALVVLGHILGQGRTSRLYRALVDTGLVADASAWASNFGHSDPFLFFCSGVLSEGVTPEQVEPVYYGVIRDLAEHGPHEAELARARKGARVSHIFDLDSIERQAGALVEFELMTSWRELDDYLPGIEAVTAADVQRVAAEYLTQRNRTVGVYRAIRPQQTGKPKLQPSGAITEAEAAGEPKIGVVPPQYRSSERGQPCLPPRAGGGGAPPILGVSGAGGTAPVLSASSTGATFLTTFDNGLTLAVRESRSNPTISLHGLLQVGRIDDPEEMPGLGGFGIEMLSSGTEQHDKLQLAALLEDNGIEVQFAAGREATTFGARALSEDFDTLLDVLGEMMLSSIFPDPEVDKTRQETLSDLLDSMHSTRGEGAVAARKLIYGDDHPFAGRINGDPDSVRRISRTDLQSWYAESFGLSGAIVTIVGDVDAKEAAAKIEARLGGAKRNGEHLSRHDALLERGAEFLPIAGERRHVEIAEKSNCSLYWVGPGVSKLEERWPACFVANFIFGGDFYSRLNERLRVAEGLTYGSSSRFVCARGMGPLLVSAQVSPKKVDRAIEAAREEMARFSAEGVTEDELGLARSYLMGNFPVQLSTNGAVAALLTDSLYLGRGVDYIERYHEVIESVTLEQVNAAAKELYDPARFALVSAGTLA